MKRIVHTQVVTAVFLIAATAILAQGPARKNSGFGRQGSGAGCGQLGLVSVLPYEELSQDEIDALMLMREEEKLARDVYLALYDSWNLPIFSNIAGSEQRHFDGVGTLIEKYGLVDSAENELGVFAPGSSMQALYKELVAAGEASQEAALRVGATIEDMDIYDLRKLLGEVDNRDIQFVFQNLLNGSMNHLRAFTRLLRPEVYDAQYLSQEEVDEIISSVRERGRYGNGRGSCAHCRTEMGPGAGNCGRCSGGSNTKAGRSLLTAPLAGKIGGSSF